MSLQHLAELLDFVEISCEKFELDRTTSHNTKLAVEEICVNLLRHGYPENSSGSIDVCLERQDDCLIITISDNAPSFAPNDAVSPDIDQDVDARQAGGLGLLLVRELMDEIHYDPRGEKGNRLRLIKHLANAKDKENSID